MLQNAQSMQSLHNINLDNYGYGMTGGMNGGNTFQDMMVPQRGMPHSMHMGEQGLSPPYSNQSPPHSVQSNLALSPQGYIGEWQKHGKNLEKLIKMCFFLFILGSPSPAKARPSLPTSPTHIQAMRHATQQKHGVQMMTQQSAMQQQTSNSLGGGSSGTNGQLNNLSNSNTNSAMLASLQMSFVNGSTGLELAGFCSPTGKNCFLKIFFLRS